MTHNKWRHCNTYSGIGSKYFAEKKYVVKGICCYVPSEGFIDKNTAVLVRIDFGVFF